MKRWQLVMASAFLALTASSSVLAFNPGGSGGSGGDPTNPASPETGAFDKSLTHDGRQRTYTVHVPPHYTQADGLPLVVDLHGLSSTGGAQRLVSGYHRLHDAADDGFVIAYPQGVGNSWNAGRFCCGTASREGVDDVGFIRVMVESIRQEWPKVDPSRIYVTGLSNGSAMTQHLAVNASDLFAAAAGYSMTLVSLPPRDRQPIPYANFHGYSDGIINHSVVEGNVQRWVGLNTCNPVPDKVERLTPAGTAAEPNKCEYYTSCADGVQVMACGVRGGHAVYNNTDDIDVTQMGWDFMKQFRRQ